MHFQWNTFLIFYIFCPQSFVTKTCESKHVIFGVLQTCFSFNLMKIWVLSLQYLFFLCLLNRPSEKHSFSVDVLIIHQRIRNRNDEVQEVLSFATQEVQKITMTAVFRDHQHRTWKRAGKMTKIEQLWQKNPSMTSFWCFYMVSSW